MTRHVGRVKVQESDPVVPGAPGGDRADEVTPGRGRAAPPDPTTAMPQPPRPVPVFVDDTGRRRRRLRLAVIWLGVVALLVVALIWWNQSAEPVRPAPIRTCAPAGDGGGCPS